MSPAAKGGLVSFFDFIIAANGVPLRSLDTTFIELIKVRIAHIKHNWHLSILSGLGRPTITVDGIQLQESLAARSSVSAE
jgi:hypothetical protein